MPLGAADLFLVRPGWESTLPRVVRYPSFYGTMTRTGGIACLILLTCFAASHTDGQLQAPLNATGEPYSISRGSTFTASGGSESAARRIAVDIREASEIIDRNYFDRGASEKKELSKSSITGMLHALDPHSNYHDAAEWRELLDDQQSGYTGIGVTIADFRLGDAADTFVLSTRPGTPAAQAGLRFGDRIVAIDGEKMSGRASSFVRDKIRGTEGTSIHLTIEHAAGNLVEIVSLRRKRVSQPSIPDAYMLRPGVGYIDLSEGFNYTTADEFDKAMRELKRGGMKSLILDMRGNGGGIVDQAVKIAERFLPAGTVIVTQRGRAPMDNRTWKSSNPTPETMPLVVLVNNETASAAEIVAGAFQDEDRALIVGEKTYGKGLVQTVINLPGKTGLTLTTARYLTPSGRSIQRDYSKGELYDYFNHKTPAAAIDTPFFEARTITNRRVFGGDGIQPDKAAELDRITSIQVSLLDPIFFFTRELINGRINGREAYRTEPSSFGKRIAHRDLPVSQTLIDDFNRFATSNAGGRLSSEALKNNALFIRLRLRHSLIMSSFGTVSANQILTEDDPQVGRSVEALPRAAQLADLARKAKTRNK